MKRVKTSKIVETGKSLEKVSKSGNCGANRDDTQRKVAKVGNEAPDRVIQDGYPATRFYRIRVFSAGQLTGAITGLGVLRIEKTRDGP